MKKILLGVLSLWCLLLLSVFNFTQYIQIAQAQSSTDNTSDLAPKETPSTNIQTTTTTSTTLDSNVLCTRVGDPKEDKPEICSAPTPVPASGGGTPGEIQPFTGEVNVVYYCQGNTQWQNTCSLGLAGCGTTSMAMILSSFGVTITPPEVDKEWGFRSCGNEGSRMEDALKSPWFKNKGFESASAGLISGGALDLTLAKQYLDAKWLIVGSSHHYPCANCLSPGSFVDHIFVVDAVDISNNTVDIRDPNNCSYADGNDEDQSKRVKANDSFTWAYAYAVRRIP